MAKNRVLCIALSIDSYLFVYDAVSNVERSYVQ